MARKDLDKLVSWMRSDKDSYFEKVVRDLRGIIPAAIKTHDRITAEGLVNEIVKAYWYWDKRVPRVKDWNNVPEEKMKGLVEEREKARKRRDMLMELLLVARDAADHARADAHGDKRKKGLALKIVRKIDECERQWMLVAEKRIAEGEMGGRWSVRIR